jgi:tight adherence protein C
LKRLRGLRNARSEQLTEKLLRAGLRAGHAAGIFLLAKLACPLLLAVALWLFILVLGGSPSAVTGLLLTAAALGLGLFLPDIYLANRATKRRQALQSSLPDGLDLLVICAEAGLTLDVALVRVSEELTRASPDLADELAITSVELNFLPDRRQALANLAKRGDVPSLRGVVNALIQTERYGTPLAQSLRVLSAELRDQRMLRAEERAARLPALLTVPMIVFILPTLFIVLIGPAIIDVLAQMAN